jgi:hypothetical protein
MTGLVGFDDVRSRVSPKSAWFELRSRSGTDGVPAADPAVAAWLADGCPKRRGADYARFFFELDAWSEYWDLYHPETKGLYHFGDGASPGYLSAFLPDPDGSRAPIFDAWKAYALASRDEGGAAGPRAAFEREARGAAEAVLAVDALVRGLVGEHFGEGPELDGDAYLDAIERFALDELPECPERHDLLPDDDSRKPYAGQHRMAGDVMWFAWAVHLECVRVVDRADALRALLMAGVALGTSMDYAFTGRCRTRSEYESADAAAWARIWERARECASDFDRAAAEVRDLFFIRAYGDD